MCKECMQSNLFQLNLCTFNYKLRMIRSSLISLLLCIALSQSAQKEIPLYDGKIPNSKDPGSERGVIFNNEVDEHSL